MPLLRGDDDMHGGDWGLARIEHVRYVAMPEHLNIQTGKND